MYVNLPHHFKGTHMSRFIEILNRFHGRIDLDSFRQILTEMKLRLQAAAAHMELDFPYFLRKKGGSASAAIHDYRCKLHGSLHEEEDLTLEVQIPIWPPLPIQGLDLLPKSLGRWGVADICLRFRHFLWIEDLIEAVEEITSHDLRWPATPGDGEERAQSVEQTTKAIGEQLASLGDNISWFTVTVKNFSEGYTTFSSLEWPEPEQHQ
jgi:GTP cyclohydrolase I